MQDCKNKRIIVTMNARMQEFNKAKIQQFKNVRTQESGLEECLNATNPQYFLVLFTTGLYILLQFTTGFCRLLSNAIYIPICYLILLKQYIEC